MPNIVDLDYRPGLFLRFTHFNTIGTALFRSVPQFSSVRHRLELSDNDFMDLDCHQNGSQNVVILIHGLEGDANRPYMRGMAMAFHKIGFDSIRVNLRGCSGESNRLLKSYHSGSTDDLQSVIDYVLETKSYSQIILVGFSLGGNIVLKYTGEQGTQIHPKIKAAVGISVPVDLASCSIAIGKFDNFIYNQRFLKNLRDKVHIKKDMLLPEMDYHQLLSAKNFQEFDHWFTAPANGFKSGADYYESCSSKPDLKDVHIPTLLLTSKDDTFLGDECYPYDIAEQHTKFYFMAPEHGGHVGFSGDDRKGMLWSEYQVTKFVLKSC